MMRVTNDPRQLNAVVDLSVTNFSNDPALCTPSDAARFAPERKTSPRK
jgi:hypothetical protein